MKKPRRRHSEEFKREVIDYYLDSDKPVAQICRDFSLHPSQFYSWRDKLLGGSGDERAVGERGARASKEAPPEGASMRDMADEIRHLRKELAASQRREEILKKAALILGQKPHTNMSASSK